MNINNVLNRKRYHPRDYRRNRIYESSRDHHTFDLANTPMHSTSDFKIRREFCEFYDKSGNNLDAKIMLISKNGLMSSVKMR